MFCAVMTIAQNTARSVDLPKSSEMKDGSDSLQLMLDSIARQHRTLRDSVVVDSTDATKSDSLYLTNLDSIRNKFDTDRGGSTKAVQWNDSIAQVQDSINKKKKSAI